MTSWLTYSSVDSLKNDLAVLGNAGWWNFNYPSPQNHVWTHVEASVSIFPTNCKICKDILYNMKNRNKNTGKDWHSQVHHDSIALLGHTQVFAICPFWGILKIILRTWEWLNTCLSWLVMFSLAHEPRKPCYQKGQKEATTTKPRLEKNLTNSSLSSIGGALKTVRSSQLVVVLGAGPVWSRAEWKAGRCDVWPAIKPFLEDVFVLSDCSLQGVLEDIPDPGSLLFVYFEVYWFSSCFFIESMYWTILLGGLSCIFPVPLGRISF